MKNYCQLLLLSSKSRCQTSEDGNHYYVITDYLEEHSLRSAMQRNTFTDKDKIMIILDLGKALALAHENNVIHRNVCPEIFSFRLIGMQL